MSIKVHRTTKETTVITNIEPFKLKITEGTTDEGIWGHGRKLRG
jgi:hypothetical protein